MPNKPLTDEDMARLVEIANFHNAASTGAINRAFAKRIIATTKELASWMDEVTALRAALGDVLLREDKLTERYHEIHREWESACEREQAANHLLAESHAARVQPTMEILRAIRDNANLTARCVEIVATLDAQNMGCPTLEDTDMPEAHREFGRKVLRAILNAAHLDTRQNSKALIEIEGDCHVSAGSGKPIVEMTWDSAAGMTRYDIVTDRSLSPLTGDKQTKAANLLMGLHKIVADLAPYLDKPLTDEALPRWLALDSAQKAIAQYFATTSNPDSR